MVNELWDAKKYPPRMQMDIRRRNDNLWNEEDLCEHCDGTGNEFYFMYRKCPKCDGTGIMQKGR